MRSKLLLIMIGVIMLLTACSDLTKEEVFEKMQKKVEDIKTYQCRVEVEVFGNKDSQLYQIQQWYKEGAFRLDTISPKHLEGKIVIIKGDQAKIYHPGIEQSVIIEKFKQNQEESMFLGDFITWDFKENIEFEKTVEQKQNYYVLKRDIQEDCFYHDHICLWINKKTFLPKYIKIYDQESELRVEISILNLEINQNIEDDLFIIDEAV